MVIFGLDLLDRLRLWKHPDGLKAQSPHSAVGHLDDPGDLCVGCIHLARRSRLGCVVPEEEDGQSSIVFAQPLRVLGGDAID